LPHRAPFAGLDGVIELDPGRQIVAIKTPSAGEFFAQSEVSFPAALLIEAIAQAGRLAASFGTQTQGKPGYLVSVEDFSIHPARWGDTLQLHVQVKSQRGGFVRVLGQVRVEEKLVAEGELVLSLPEGENGKR
jgi:3-hydroxyacyl-[acyl-carrier-protein] dehydratase